ncbi:MAG: DUF6198 family protein [Anaerovoracaceae bacterium]
MNSRTFTRYIIYSSGMIILALGIVLNTKTNLGVSPLISLPFSIAEIWHFNFAFSAFIMYTSYTLLEIILKGKSRQIKDWLQIPLSVVFSVLLQILGDFYDKLISSFDINITAFPQRFVMLLIGVALTGIGVSMTVNMQLIPNPADGLAKVVGHLCRKNLGFGKNLIDTLSVITTCFVGLIFRGKIIGIGIGTIVAMIGVGRCIFAVNYLFKSKMLSAAELNENVIQN